MEGKIKILFCYAREDETLQQRLEMQIKPLQRQGLVEIWHDRNISAGTEWKQAIDKRLNTAQIILLLVSPDFLDSDFCYGIEMEQAIERHKRGETCIIPIILRPVYWQKSPFSLFQALPTNARSIIDASWHNLDEAFFDVAEGIRRVVECMTRNSLAHLSAISRQPLNSGRSNNLNGKSIYENNQTVKILLRLQSVKKTISMHVDLKNSVEYVLAKIVQVLELPGALDRNRMSYVLLFEGYPLELNESLASAGIEEGAVLQLGAYSQ